MGIISTQAFTFRLVANGQELDLFEDEDIKISNNITGLFDIGQLPSDFTRQITLPGTKVNNAFFEHCYDISIDSPFLFATNIKVPAYFDFDSVYLSQGYLQLNKVNVLANKFIDSYEVTIYGTLSSFGRDINRLYLTDLSTLSAYNHTSSVANISASWNGNLFNGDIVYPLADYGSGWQYTSGDDFFGIDDAEGALRVQNFKPAIRVKKVWDAVFEQTGYTYSSSFWNQSFLDDIYMICDYSLKYPEYSGVDLETYGLGKISAISASGQVNWSPTINTASAFPWFNLESNPQGNFNSNGSYNVPVSSSVNGVLTLNVNFSSSLNVAPALELYYWPTSSTWDGAGAGATTLVNFNNYYEQVRIANTGGGGINQTNLISTEVNTSILNPGTYFFGIRYRTDFSPTGGLTMTVDPDGKPQSFLQIKALNNAADNRVIDIPSNMPYGTNGIKLIDFIIGLQKKFNLIIYPDKTKPNRFIVETFNDWYKRGEVKDFNKYINLDDKIEYIPANNLAVNELNFGDTLDQDYISQQFAKGANREYSKTYYTDTTNFYSQGKLEVKTTFASTPLLYVNGTGLSGSVGGITPSYSCYNYVSKPIPVPNTMTWLDCAGVSQTQYIPPYATINLGCGREGSHSGPVTQGTACS
jgi:hypothetical protein